ncbi:MAG: hypothetical protein R3C26_26420 [Calditrichia bacterium]
MNKDGNVRVAIGEGRSGEMFDYTSDRRCQKRQSGLEMTYRSTDYAWWCPQKPGI